MVLRYIGTQLWTYFRPSLMVSSAGIWGWQCKEKAKTCKSFFTCAYKVLHQYSLNSTAYSELYTVCHFLLTLAITQVDCERSFSKLKLIKTRLQSSLSQENLESLMLMSVETDILNKVSLDKVVDMLSFT